ncbi:MAG: tRNA (N(6)-L-threonylcarbamoyladenosine(37)-C(2))-methylthiotransferase MtaB [Candidatus Brocadiae bacterium]|nr:tRNA (N(6)-L-threonylcarbamoyladenosine(37)-C(2))-methylthiotransferase MtaB [Candidatus Brocadiia bacterium]
MNEELIHPLVPPLKKIAFVTLGCKVNQYETQIIRESFPPQFYGNAERHEEADIFIINTCTVTSRSDQKTRKIIRNLKKSYPNAFIVITGCYAERSAEELESMPEVDLVVGNKDKQKIAEKIHGILHGSSPLPCLPKQEDFLHSSISEFHDHTRAFVKIQEGCESFCSYCIIPYVRGPLKSKPKDIIIQESKNLIAQGTKEIVLVGIHLGQYGKEAGQAGLYPLLQDLANLEGDYRLRLTSIEIHEVTPLLIDFIASHPKMTPHLHIPLQSGEDSVLQRMNRKYTTQDFFNTCEMVRDKISYPAITTDVIVGFPGETQEQFEKTAKFCEKIGFSRMHIFPYADREGTVASQMGDKVSEEAKKRRVEMLTQIAQKSQTKYLEGFLGKTIRVLVEQQEKDRIFSGLDEHYVRVQFVGSQEQIGHFVSVKILETEKDYLKGILE